MGAAPLRQAQRSTPRGPRRSRLRACALIICVRYILVRYIRATASFTPPQYNLQNVPSFGSFWPPLFFIILTREMKSSRRLRRRRCWWRETAGTGGRGRGRRCSARGARRARPWRMITARVNDVTATAGGEDERVTAACSHLSDGGRWVGRDACDRRVRSAAGLLFCLIAGARPMNIYHSRRRRHLRLLRRLHEATGPAASTPACANTLSFRGQEWRVDQMRARDTRNGDIRAPRQGLAGAEMSTNTATRQEMLREELQAPGKDGDPGSRKKLRRRRELRASTRRRVAARCCDARASSRSSVRRPRAAKVCPSSRTISSCLPRPTKRSGNL